MDKKKVEREYVPEFVYGALDGAITTFAIVSGAIGASLSSAIVLILGFANLFADGFSMAISNYLSTKSQNDLLTKHKHPHFHIRNPKKTALATFAAFVIIGFIPLLSFVLSLFIPALQESQFTYSILLTAVAFLIIGYNKARITEKGKARSCLETLVVGGIAALIAYGVGFFLRGLVG